MPAPTGRKNLYMHTHVGVLVIGSTFIGVVLAGTLWRLVAMQLAAHPERPTLMRVGQAMAVQY